MKYAFIFSSALIALIISSCSDNTEQATEEPSKPKVKETFEQRVKHEIETALEIPASEKYNLKIYKGQLSSDGIEDAIITINRPEFAQNEAIRTDRVSKFAEVDFTGYYNYFVYYDGATDSFSSPVKIGSAPARELDVEFSNITSPSQQDVSISYRIKNSGFRKFYTVVNGKIELMFEWDWFMNAGEKESKAVFYDIVNDMSPISKDIILYESVIDNDAESTKDVYGFEPVITRKGKLIYHFFYDQNYHKYRGLPNE